MLEQLARHGLIDLTIKAKGDLHIDQHHTIEDVGIVLGQALKQGARRPRRHHPLRRRAPADGRGADALRDRHLRAAVSRLEGRRSRASKIGEFDTELFREFFQALAQNAGITLHVETLYGHNNHHIAETCFKAVARALRAAVAIDPRQAGRVPSTKGRLTG